MGTASNEPGFKSALGACYTGPPLDCSGIEIKIFGGGGEGAYWTSDNWCSCRRCFC